MNVYRLMHNYILKDEAVLKYYVLPNHPRFGTFSTFRHNGHWASLIDDDNIEVHLSFGPEANTNVIPRWEGSPEPLYLKGVHFL